MQSMTYTTDPQDEPFDVLDGDGRPTGAIKPRGEIHRDGDWHRGLHIWVYGFDEEERPFVVFQRRSEGKDTWPGALDVAVGGHFRAGETLNETLREAEEEIGLAASIDDLVPIGQRFIDDHGPNYIDRELNEVLALRCDQPLTGYILHPDEVAGIVTIELDQVMALFTGTMDTATASEVRLDGSEHHITVTVSDFAGDREDYALAALAGIQTIANGNMPEPFLILA
jgi:isopentenyldiphosphate isomerase